VSAETTPAPSSGGTRRETLIAIAVLAIAVAAVYGHTLNAPFELDDVSSILENEWIRPGHSFADLWRFAPLRVIGYLSFALNYRFGAFDPRGYHLVNIVVHFLAACACFGFARALLRTPRVRDSFPAGAARGLPLLAGLLFALHPLQTAAVSYVVQRLASLGALFYITSLACFVQARLARTTRVRVPAILACVVSSQLALLTKESTVTLPLALALIECVCFRHTARGRVGVALAGLGGAIVVWLGIALVFGRNPFAPETVQSLTSDAALVTRSQYLATQLTVLWGYARLFVWPAGLHLDHSDAHLDGFGHPIVALAIAGHLLALGLALGAARKRPLLGFGLLFWYLAHSVESSLFPLQDMMFEHRAYLPDLGLCLAGSWLLAMELPRWIGGRRRAWEVTAVILVALGVVTWRRNQMWRDPILLWEDNVKLAPDRARAWGILARHYSDAHRHQDAVAALEHAIDLRTRKGGPEVGDPLDIVNLAIALQGLGRNDEAARLVASHIDRPMDPRSRSLLWLQRGNLDYAADRLPEAESAFTAALAFDSTSVPARANLASTWARTGRLAPAESLFAVVAQIDPDHRGARINLLQARAGRLIDEAQRHARAGHRMDARRTYESALEALEELSGLEPGNPAAAPTIALVKNAISELDSATLRH
jgi:Tfp pilus assembly protein PilF